MSNTVTLRLNLTGDAAQKIHDIGIDQISLTKKVNEQLGLSAQVTGKIIQQGQQVTSTLREQVNQTGMLSRLLDATQRNGQLLEQHMAESAKQAQSLKAAIAGSGMSKAARDSQEIARNTEKAARNWKQMAGHVLNKAVSAGAGLYAAGEVIKDPLERARAYNKSLAYDALTFTEKSNLPMTARVGYAHTLQQQILEATRSAPGMSLENGEEAAKALIRSGLYSPTGTDKNGLSNATVFKSALGQTLQFASASGAEPAEAAALQTSFRQMGITTPEGIQKGYDMVFKAGSTGRFHAQDAARFLPEVLPDAMGAGKIGLSGLRDVLAELEVGMNTAGTTGEAATNIKQMHSLFASQHFARMAAQAVEVEPGDPVKAVGKRNPTKRFDVNAYYLQMQRKGIDVDDAAYMLINRELSKQHGYQQLVAEQKKLKALPNQDDASLKAQQENLEKMMQISMHTKWGEFFHNQESRMGYAALSNSMMSGDFPRIQGEIGDSKGATGEGTQFLNQFEFSKAQGVENEWQNGRNNLYDDVSKSLGGLEDSATKLMEGHQTLTKVAYSTALAVGALGGAALASSGVKMITGGVGGAAGGLGGVLAARVGLGAGAAGLGTTAAGVAGAGLAGYGIGSAVRWGYLHTDTGRSFDDHLGGMLANLMHFFSDDAQGAIEQREKYDKMIEQGNQQLDVLKNISTNLRNQNNSVMRSPPIPALDFQETLRRQQQRGIGQGTVLR